jgi:hypothetical protein
MTHPATLSRRQLLALLPGAVALAAGWPVRAHNEDPRLAACRALFRRHAGAAEVGAAYLARFPGESDPLRLLALLDVPAQVSGVALRAWVQERARADFAREETVDVGGWLLSRTEARLCGLVRAGERRRHPSWY